VTASRWLPYRSELANASLRVFCFPHAGGGASAFRPWIMEQPRGAEICAVQLPGREDRIRESLPKDIGVLTGALASVLLPHLDVPYVLVGNSLGALVAFELARYLQQSYCLPPIHLVAAASRPPGTNLRLPEVSRLTDEELAAAVQDRHGSIPQEMLSDPTYLAAFAPTLRADISMVEGYLPSPEPALACSITAVVGTDDAGISHSDLGGWRAFTEGSFECVELPGDHFVLLRRPRDILERIYAEAGIRPGTDRAD
jgi:medium-chain acyl-[acyl-carrier-protein] hydrolase